MPSSVRQLLQTKLQRPRTTQTLVARPRLNEQLNQGSRGPLTLVCAPAGYGKTTLVSAWLEGLAGQDSSGPLRPAAWISLDEEDSDFGSLLRYLIGGLRGIFAGACADAWELLRAGPEPPPEVLFATLVNEIAGLPRDFVLVLDDHQRTRGSAASDLIGELIRHWPQPMHMILISRYVPALPLAPMRASGQVTEIRTHDLRFTLDEVAAYLNRTLPGRLNKSSMELLERRTEGWIAGLQLAILSLQDAEDPETFLANVEGTGSDFADYLISEVLAHQPAPVQAFLLQTSVLDTFCRSLCEATVSEGDSEWNAERCIDWLEQRNLFTIPLDGHKEWYRYHHMFRSLLQQRSAGAFGRDGLVDLHCRAAGWYAGHDLLDQAMRHALAANDVELAARLAEQGLCDVLNREDRPTLERWVRLFPDEFVENHAGLLVMKAWSLQFSWQLGAQAKILQRIAALLDRGAADRLPEETLAALRGQVAVLSGQEAYQKSKAARARARCREALALLPKSWSFARSWAMLYLALSLQADGKSLEAEQLLVENYKSLSDKTGTYALRLLMALCLVYYAEARDLDRVRSTAQKLLEEAERGKLPILQSWGHYLLGLVHYHRNELSDAAGQLRSVVNSLYTGQIAVVRDSMIRLALIDQIRGRQEDAWEMAGRLVQLDLDRSGYESDQMSALRARLCLMQGDMEGAARWADAFAEPLPSQALLYEYSPHLIRAEILVTRGTGADLDTALQILGGLDKAADRTHNTRLKIEALALRALVLGAQRQHEAAAAALMDAITLSRPGGFVRIFLNLGPPMRNALRHLLTGTDLPGPIEAPAADAIRRILTEFPGEKTGSPPARESVSERPRSPVPGVNRTDEPGQEPLVEHLTSRELEVLLLLREPTSIKEIARELCISYLTAKRHTANIYGKLGVNTRWAAVARAEATDILHPR